MKLIQKFSIPLLIIMMFALPCWITVGKEIIFGVGGWFALISMFTIAPALFVVLLVFLLLLVFRKDIRENRGVGKFDSILLLSVYLSVFLFSLFIVDGGDTPESVNSVMTKYGFMNFELSGVLSETFMVGTVLLMIVGFVVFVFELIKKEAITLPTR